MEIGDKVIARSSRTGKLRIGLVAEIEKDYVKIKDEKPRWVSGYVAKYRKENVSEQTSALLEEYAEQQGRVKEDCSDGRHT